MVWMLILSGAHSMTFRISVVHVSKFICIPACSDTRKRTRTGADQQRHTETQAH
jgi:hypothetical protein